LRQHRTGHREGLATNIKEAFPPVVLQGVVLLLLIANTLNIAADVAAMGEVAELVSGIERHLMTALSGSASSAYRYSRDRALMPFPRR